MPYGKQVDGEKMKRVAKMLKKELPGLGFALITFEFDKPGMRNYVSNAQRNDMITALYEVAERLRKQKDFLTPTDN